MDRLLAIIKMLKGQTSTLPSDFHPTTDSKRPRTRTTKEEEDQAAAILSFLLTSEKPTRDLELQIQPVVYPTGWYEGLSKRILDGLVAALESGAAMGIVMQEAFDKASAVANEFVKEHPVFTAALVTVVAIGILVILVPWTVEALGFGELGPIEGSFASVWQSTFPDIEAGSFFSFLQRLGIKWRSKL